MSPRCFTYLIPAFLGLGGFLVWKYQYAAERSHVGSSTPPRQVHRTSARPPSLPTRLDFLADISQPYQVRISLLRNTAAAGFSDPELRFLYQFLEKSPPIGELPEEWYVIANDVMALILVHETDPQRFASNFTGLLNDSHQPEVIRDYAVQYLAAWLNPRTSSATERGLPAPSPEVAGPVLLTLAAATVDPALEQSSIPGTTLMMLGDLARSESGIDCAPAIAVLKPWLHSALQDGSYLSNPVRVSAISAAALFDPAGFRPVIRKIAYQADGGGSLRLPAIAALGQSGEEEDLVPLRQIAATSSVFSYAAQDASNNLESKLRGNTP